MNKLTRERVLKILAEVVTDTDVTTLAPDINLRDQTDFDSMDTLRFAIGLKKEFGFDIPDVDFPHLASIARCLAYLERLMPPSPPASQGDQPCASASS
jgi:acyl carrier protein